MRLFSSHKLHLLVGHKTNKGTNTERGFSNSPLERGRAGLRGGRGVFIACNSVKAWRRNPSLHPPKAGNHTFPRFFVPRSLFPSL